jgi:hypothetical protein
MRLGQPADSNLPGPVPAAPEVVTRSDGNGAQPVLEVAFMPVAGKGFESTDKHIMRHLLNLLRRDMAADNTEHATSVAIQQMLKKIHITIQDAANNIRITHLIRVRYISAVSR